MAKRGTKEKPDRTEKDLITLEKRILELKSKRALLIQKLPRRRVEDYTLTGDNGKPLRLAKAFGNRSQDLIVVHNMGRSCSYCTLWADEMNGVLHHLESRAAFLLTSPDDPMTQRLFKKSRGWRFAMASTRGTTFAKDMGFEPEPGRYWPGVTTFHKRKDGKIERVASAPFGPGDDFCAVWHFFDLVDGGSDGWHPRLNYSARSD